MSLDIGLTPREGAFLPPEELEDHAADLHEHQVHDELRKLRARHDARVRFAAELAPVAEPFDVGTLAQVLARPAEPAARVDGLIPWEAGTLLSAQRKTGKTTTALNLARSLLTGEDFLGTFGVRPLDGTVALLNYEVSAAQVARWAAECNVPPDRLLLVNVRGRRNPLREVEDRQRLGALLRRHDVETVLCDPFGRAYTGASQNDAGEVGAWLVALDTFTRSDVGARDLVLTAHAGWNGERTRGSSALEDWADSIITLTRDDTNDGDGSRYLRATGRDVDVPEDRLAYDADTRTLTLSGAGSRKSASADRRVADLSTTVLSTVLADPGITGSGVGNALREAGVMFRKGEELTALHDLVSSGRLLMTPGPRNAKRYSDATTSPHLPPHPPGVPQ